VSIGQRLEVIESVLADPPNVHAFAPRGIWETDASAYRFMAEHCEPGSQTLETGLGISTLLFGLWGANHTCVVGDQGEVDRLVAHAEARKIDLGKVRFEVGRSDDVLPALEGPPLDLVLVDGSHAFPLAIIDWYYAAGRLRAGGLVVLDDMQLTQVSLGLRRFLGRDPRWTSVAGTRKWAAYRRETEHSLSEEWLDQEFIDRKFGPKRSLRAARAFAKRLLRR
jgi:methyltransferase family protein